MKDQNIDKTLDILHDGGLLKKIIKEGDGLIIPRDVTAVIHYTGRLQDGTVFDSSVERHNPFQFKIGRREVILGWELGVATMRKGEKCLLTCNSTYGYGKTEVGSIPGDSTIEYEMELLSWDGQKEPVGMVAIVTTCVFLGFLASFIGSLWK